jgi:hypothetical protein
VGSLRFQDDDEFTDGVFRVVVGVDLETVCCLFTVLVLALAFA